MQVNKTDNHTNFKAKISPNFNKVVQNFFNYSSFPNKRKNIYTFTKKAEVFEKFGHNDYVIDYERKLRNNICQHYLVASNGSRKVILAERNNLLGIIIKFLTMNGYEFYQKIIKG